MTRTESPNTMSLFYAELNGDAKAMQSCFILSGVIGGLEVDLEDIAQPIPRW
jgi:hypothetical protein